MLATLAGTGCGEPVVGGSGRLQIVDGVRHLRLEGHPYEMGWWQGRLLAEEILVTHESRWSVLAGVLGAEATAALRGGLDVIVEQALGHLPEAARLEMDGLAAATGLAVEDQLRLALAGDLARFQGHDAHLLRGALAVEGRSGRAEALLEGPIAAGLRDRWLVVERRPAGGEAPTLMAAWPGSLGGIAGVSARGVAMVAVEAPALPAAQQMGRAPFPWRVRRALAGAADASGVLMALGGVAAHRVAIVDAAGGALLGRVGLAATVDVDLAGAPRAVLPAEAAAEALEVPTRPAPPLGREAAGPDATALAVVVGAGGAVLHLAPRADAAWVEASLEAP